MPHCTFTEILDSLLDGSWGQNVESPKELAQKVMRSRTPTVSDVCLMSIARILRDTLRALTEVSSQNIINDALRKHHRNVDIQIQELEALHGPCDDALRDYLCQEAVIRTLSSVASRMSSGWRFGHHTSLVAPPERGTEMRKKWDRWIRRRAKKVVDAG